MKTRAEKIAAGLVWHVYRDSEPDNTLFEGTKTACVAWLRAGTQWHEYKRGALRVGRVIWGA